MAKRENKAEGVNELPDLELGVNRIKGLFKAGAVPRQADYEKLIEYVNYLHKLLGVEKEGEEEYVPKLGAGLVASGGVLSVGEGPGIKVSEDSVSVNLDSLAGKGLVASEGKLNIGQSFWIDVSEDGIDVGHKTWEVIFTYIFGTVYAYTIAVSECCVFNILASGDNYVVRGFSRGGASFEKGAISKCKLNDNLALVAGSEINLFEALLLFPYESGVIFELEIPLSRNELGVPEVVKLTFRFVGEGEYPDAVSTSS